jgi:glycerol-3-phosphate O-acyltransferase
VIFPITVAAFSFLTSSIVTSKNRFVSIEQLYADKNSLFIDNTDVLDHFSSSYQIHWPSENDKTNIKQRLLSLYSDVFELVDNNHLTLKMTGDHLTDSALLLKLIMYRNTCLHLFAKPAYILLACQANSQVEKTNKLIRLRFYFSLF